MQKIKFLFIIIMMMLSFIKDSSAQNMQEATLDGFYLKKVVSDTSIPSGQTFTYYLHFTIPAGISAPTVYDNLPLGVVFDAISVPSGIGSPTVTAPAINTNGSITLQWAGTTTMSYSGMVAVTVHFPNGTTCNSLNANNVLSAFWSNNGKAYKLDTRSISTLARASDPWNIYKWGNGLAYVGGACPYITAKDTIDYQIQVYKNVGTTGQLNLVNGIVRDTLPPGATLVSSSCGMTQSGNVITWNIGSLSALPMYSSSTCSFKVRYPIGSFPNNSVIKNKATLVGTLGSLNPSCGTIKKTSNEICITKKSITSARLSKYAYTTGQPGCSGFYQIYIYNNGTTNLSYTLKDTLPVSLTYGTITSYAGGGAATMTTPTLVGGILTTTGASLAPGSGAFVRINFTIPLGASVGSTITNCATLTGTSNPIRSCHSFIVTAPTAKACIWKEICNKQTTYTLGNIFRYRLRVQNIGGVSINGANIQDVLNTNLSYVPGTASFYSSTSWDAPCQTTTNWSGVTIANVGNSLNISLPSIPATCQNTFFSNCGQYGTWGVPFYFIEFDVKVVDTAALGNTPNFFVLSGSNIATQSSNTDLVTIVGNLGLGAVKEVSTDNITWASAVNTTPNATIFYRLRSNISPGSVGLRYMNFVDLLPMNNGASDGFVISGCINRNSNFGVAYASAGISSPSSTGYSNSSATLANINNYNPYSASVLFSGCGTSGTWTSGIPTGSKNLAYYFGANAIGSSAQATTTFGVQVASTASIGKKACNSFALNGFVKYLLNAASSPTYNFTQCTPVESGAACTEIKESPKPCLEKVEVKIECKGKDVNGNQQYAIYIVGSTSTAATNVSISTPAGSLTPSTFSVSSGSFNINTTFVDILPVNNPIKIYFTLADTNSKICRDSIEIKLPECPEEKNCCTGFIHTFSENDVRYDAETDEVHISGYLNAGPNKIQNFNYSVVSAERTIYCEGNAIPERIYGDIIYSKIGQGLYPGYAQVFQNFTREVKWGKYEECFDLISEGMPFYTILKFPFPPQPCDKCYDVLRFAIRYYFTDCNCITCDTIIHYEIKRQCSTKSIGIGSEKTTEKSIEKDMSFYSMYLNETSILTSEDISQIRISTNSENQIVSLGTNSNTSSLIKDNIAILNVSSFNSKSPIVIAVKGKDKDASYIYSILDRSGNNIWNGSFGLYDENMMKEIGSNLALNIIVSPNPNAGRATISICTDKELEAANAFIVDNSGKLVYSVFSNEKLNIGTSIFPVNLEHLSDGNYIVVLKNAMVTKDSKFSLTK